MPPSTASRIASYNSAAKARSRTRARCHRFPTASRRLTRQVNQIKEAEPLSQQLSLNLGKDRRVLSAADPAPQDVVPRPIHHRPQLNKAARFLFPHVKQPNARW